MGVLWLWVYRAPIAAVLRDPSQVQARVVALGAWGPVLLIGLIVIQIVIAPIPGYAIYVAAGWLYGTWWGGLWGSIGLLGGGMLAMWVGRRFGRTLVARLIGADTLTHYADMLHSDSRWLWFGLLVSPIGDVPFLLAGISTIRYRDIFGLTVITRTPIAFAAAAFGAGVMHLTWWQIAGIALLLLLPYWAATRYGDRMKQWVIGGLRRLAARE